MTEIKVTLVDSMGGDLSVVNAARVSFGKKSEWVRDPYKDEWGHTYDLKLSEKDEKLIKYLAKHKHISPFGHCFASFHVKAPLFVARQLVKHKFLRWNEVSRRYVDDEPEFYVPEVWRKKADNVKQGSSDESVGGDVPLYVQEKVYETCLDSYKTLMEVGVAPEQARMVLPQSMMTEWYWSGSLDAFADMCNLRLKGDTQYESRLVAQGVDKEMSRLYPVSWEALTND